MSDIKLVYIGNKGCSDPDHGLTINKIYIGEYLHREHYVIHSNDYGITYYYHRSFFRNLKEVRSKKLESIGI